jgi:hypothetical protein
LEIVEIHPSPRSAGLSRSLHKPTALCHLLLAFQSKLSLGEMIALDDEELDPILSESTVTCEKKLPK